MSGRAPISQVKYWLEGSTANNSNAEDDTDAAVHLSYDVFVGLSVLGGFFGLDHLYLRSPWTFLAKFVVNLFFSGIWWIYDAVHALFNSDTVRVYGLGIPGWGPAGIGAGVLSKDVPDRKHFRFLFYAIALMFGGMIGLDSFVVGNNQMGIFRMVCTFTLLLAPLSLLQWGYHLFNFFVNTEEVISNNYKFFGAPYHSVADWMRARFPLLSLLFSPLETIKYMINKVIGPSLIEPITKTAQSAINTVEHAVSTVDNTVQLGRNIVSKSSNVIDQVGKTIDTLSQVSTFTPAASLYATAQGALAQKGGSVPSVLSAPSVPLDNLNTIGYVLLGTLCIIVLTGFSTTFYRIYHGIKREQPDESNQPKQPDDTPPEPGVL